MTCELTPEQLAKVDAWAERQVKKAPKPTPEMRRAVGAIVARALAAEREQTAQPSRPASRKRRTAA